MNSDEIVVREVEKIDEIEACVRLQREVFAFPEAEVSPIRHFIVTQKAGGFTLGAFVGGELVGFVLSVMAFSGNEKYFYSHMTAVSKKVQNQGIGARLKWAQRKTALSKGVNFIKWTFQPVQARNAFFNLEKLGAVVREYQPNFYGTDYSTSDAQDEKTGLDSDRLFGEWQLDSAKVIALSNGENFKQQNEIAQKIEIPGNWNELVKTNPGEAIRQQERIKGEFQTAFDRNLVAKGFVKSEKNPHYLLFEN